MCVNIVEFQSIFYYKKVYNLFRHTYIHKYIDSNIDECKFMPVSVCQYSILYTHVAKKKTQLLCVQLSLSQMMKACLPLIQ